MTTQPSTAKPRGMRRAAVRALCIAALWGAWSCSQPDAASVPPAPEAGPDAPRGIDGGLDHDTVKPADFLEPAFVSDPLGGCILATPRWVRSAGTDVLFVAAQNAQLTALAPDGKLTKSFALPVLSGQTGELASTPLVIGQRAVLAWQSQAGGTRREHRVAVFDLDTWALDPAFPIVSLAASVPAQEGGFVDFLPEHAFSRAALVHLPRAGGLGSAYVTLGNQRDLQPWHGWAFEIDLDAWRGGGASRAITSVLNSTPTNDCGAENGDGARDDRCGGGMWSAMGPKVREGQLVIATGNGATVPPKGLYANAVLRVGPGLQFSSGCDADACAAWDKDSPTEACMSSCANVFLPRLAPGQPPLAPESGACDGLSFLACYRRLDLDLGAGSPSPMDLPSGKSAWLLPAKDGAVYLFDASHMGTMYDRLQVTAICGTKTDPCQADWAGTMVTEPLLTTVDGLPLALIPTFMPDQTHPAGVVALRVRDDSGKPKLERVWSAPRPESAEAKAWFRWHPSRMVLLRHALEDAVAVVDSVEYGGNGALVVIRVRDGAVLGRQLLVGSGQRYVVPSVRDGVLTVSSCGTDGRGRIEAFRTRP